ncbi:hypothetical protein H4F05_13670 [Vibrio cholerae]
MNQMHNKAPIFVHSLFRSGSTYVFNQFRNSNSPYWCYQEPLHEKAIFAKSDFRILLESDDSTAKLLRHPELNRPYFWELFEVAPTCLKYIDEASPYKSFFREDEATIDYFTSLVEESKARPVIQECRTSARIDVLKRRMGGEHIYLWRNPWDQWWSYKVLDYFDTANQVILNADDVPLTIDLLRKKIRFKTYQAENLNDEFFWYKRNKLSFDESYLAFYVLWLLSLIEAMQFADLLINMDTLSSNDSYTKKIELDLVSCGISGIEFGNCNSPFFHFHRSEIERFRKIEEVAHSLFIDSGVDAVILQRALDEKERHSISFEEENCNSQSWINESFKARKIAERYHEECLEIKAIGDGFINHISSELNHEITKLREEAIAKDLLIENYKNTLKEESLIRNEYKDKYELVVQSRLWKLTEPIRQITTFLRGK